LIWLVFARWRHCCT